MTSIVYYLEYSLSRILVVHEAAHTALFSPTMHPPLDRPHPECGEVIEALKQCHLSNWKMYTGGCNKIKFELDQCFKAEKKHLLSELNKDLPERRKRQEEVVKKVLGKKMTFQEYLQQDKEYQQELLRKGSK